MLVLPGEHSCPQLSPGLAPSHPSAPGEASLNHPPSASTGFSSAHLHPPQHRPCLKLFIHVPTCSTLHLTWKLHDNRNCDLFSTLLPELTQNPVPSESSKNICWMNEQIINEGPPPGVIGHISPPKPDPTWAQLSRKTKGNILPLGAINPTPCPQQDCPPPTPPSPADPCGRL